MAFLKDIPAELKPTQVDTPNTTLIKKLKEMQTVAPAREVEPPNEQMDIEKQDDVKEHVPVPALHKSLVVDEMDECIMTDKLLSSYMDLEKEMDELLRQDNFDDEPENTNK